jgi:hypothetical protein
MSINNISYSNTFFQWVNVTNDLVNKVNVIDEGNYEKSSGVLTLSNPGTSLVVANASIFLGTVTTSSNVTSTGLTRLNQTIFNSGNVIFLDTAPVIANNVITINNRLVSSNNFLRNLEVANGTTTFTNTANVIFSSNTIFSSDTVFQANNTFVGDVNIQGNFIVTGNTTINDVISGTIEYGNTANVIFNSNTIFVSNTTLTNANVTQLLVANNINVTGNTRLTGTGYLKIPVGSTSERPAPEQGLIRFNSTLIQFEGYNGTGWGTIGGGATGGVGNAVFYENDQMVTADYTITVGKNAMSAGPITIANNITVTIPTGSTWSII